MLELEEDVLPVDEVVLLEIEGCGRRWILGADTPVPRTSVGKTDEEADEEEVDDEEVDEEEDDVEVDEVEESRTGFFGVELLLAEDVEDPEVLDVVEVVELVDVADTEAGCDIGECTAG